MLQIFYTHHIVFLACPAPPPQEGPGSKLVWARCTKPSHCITWMVCCQTCKLKCGSTLHRPWKKLDHSKWQVQLFGTRYDRYWLLNCMMMHWSLKNENVVLGPCMYLQELKGITINSFKNIEYKIASWKTHLRQKQLNVSLCKDHTHSPSTLYECVPNNNM